MDPLDEKLAIIVNTLGIINQLLVTRYKQVVTDDLLPFPQFVVLSHCMKDPVRARTVTTMAAAFQAPQPGITKTVQKLLQRELLREEADPADGRRKFLFITKRGRAHYGRALAALGPDIRRIFAAMDDSEIEALHATTMKLKRWLDSNRIEG